MSEPQDTPPPVTVEAPPPLSAADRAAMEKARRGRNIALALGLVAFMVIVFAVTVIKMAANAAPHA